MSLPRHVFIVGCGFPQLGLLRAAKRLGFVSTGADLNPFAIGVSLADRFVKASTGDVSAIVSAFRESGASGIATSGSELALTTTALAAHQLGLPFYADPDTVNRCQAKDRMRAGYDAAGLPVPTFAHCSTIEQAREFFDQANDPVVIKPSHGWGQRGVSKVSASKQLDAAFAHAVTLSHGGGGVVLETCIVGHEVSVNGWVEDGDLRAYCVTDREVFGGDRPLGVMRSEIAPSVLEPHAIQRAIDTARRGARALGLRRGPCYSQVAVRDHDAILFETAARLGGGFDADVTALASGVDLYARLLGVAFGDSELEGAGQRGSSRSDPAVNPAPAMVRFLRPTPGRLLVVEGVEEARAIPGVVDAVVYPAAGTTVPPMTDAAKRVGHILVRGDSRQQIVERADRAEQAIRFTMDTENGEA